MFQAILRWIIDQLCAWAYPDTQRVVDDFKAKAAAAKQASDEAAASLQVLRQQLSNRQEELLILRDQNTATSVQLIAATAELAKARDDLQRLQSAKLQIVADADKVRAEIARMTDNQVLHSNL